MNFNDEVKKDAGSYAAGLIQAGMTVGLGTGSTAFWFITALAARIKDEGLPCRGIPTSLSTKQLAAGLGIPLVELNDVEFIDVDIDGADEIDPQLNLVKGGGGALLQEKMVAAASKQLIIIAGHNKLVRQLGAFPLPLEVVPYGWKQVQHVIETKYHVAAKIRSSGQQPFVTDHGHYILDCYFQQIPEPGLLNSELNNIPGVVENGLFINMTSMAVIGKPGGSIEILTRS